MTEDERISKRETVGTFLEDSDERGHVIQHVGEVQSGGKSFSFQNTGWGRAFCASSALGSSERAPE